jgi:hypothetical protein
VAKIVVIVPVAQTFRALIVKIRVILIVIAKKVTKIGSTIRSAIQFKVRTITNTLEKITNSIARTTIKSITSTILSLGHTIQVFRTMTHTDLNWNRTSGISRISQASTPDSKR